MSTGRYFSVRSAVFSSFLATFWSIYIVSSTQRSPAIPSPSRDIYSSGITALKLESEAPEAVVHTNPIESELRSEHTPSKSDAFYKWIGLSIVVGSAIASNLGVNVQKLSHVQEAKLAHLGKRTYFTRPVWLIGMILIVLGSIGDLIALGFAPQALVASVGGGSTVLVNVFFAHLWLGQALTLIDGIGTFLIVVGVVSSTVANTPDSQLSLEELEYQFVQTEFLVYVFLTILVLLCISSQLHAIKKRLRGGIAESQARKLPFLYATASGIVGSYSVLLAKCAAILLILTVRGTNQFVYLTTYLFVGGTVVSLVIQTDLFNRAIMEGDTLRVYPMFQCFWIGSSFIGGVVFYEKYLQFGIFEWTCLPIALVFIISGIYLLARQNDEELDSSLDVGNALRRVPLDQHPGHVAQCVRFTTLVPFSPSHYSTSSLFSRLDGTAEERARLLSSSPRKL